MGQTTAIGRSGTPGEGFIVTNPDFADDAMTSVESLEAGASTLEVRDGSASCG